MAAIRWLVSRSDAELFAMGLFCMGLAGGIMGVAVWYLDRKDGEPS